MTAGYQDKLFKQNCAFITIFWKKIKMSFTEESIQKYCPTVGR